MKKLQTTILAFLICLLTLPTVGFAARDFITDPNVDQGFLVWPKDSRQNVTYRLGITQTNRSGQVLRVKTTAHQTENYFHFDRSMRAPGRYLNAEVRAYVNGVAAQTLPPVDIRPLESPDSPISTLVCSWDCPGDGYTIEAYELLSSGGGISYVMELAPAAPSFYHYMNYSTWANGPFFPFIDDLHVVDIGDVTIADGYCQGGQALSGHIVGVRIENPYGILQTNPFFGTSPCVLANNALDAGILVEQNCSNCPPNLDIECRASNGCIGGGSSSSSNGGSYGSPYDAIDSLFFGWIYDLLDSQLDFATNLESSGAIDDLLDYDDLSLGLTAFAHKSFAKIPLQNVAKKISLYRLDDPSVAPVTYNIQVLDNQRRNSMGFSLDFSSLPAGLYNFSVILENGRQLKRLFKHAPKSKKQQSTEYFAEDALGLELYPNPANSNLNVNITNAKGSAQVRIVDLNGRMLLEQNLEVNALKYKAALSLDQFSPGIYFLEATANGQKEVQKFVVQ